MSGKNIFTLIVVVVVLVAATAIAQVPAMMNTQGRLVDSTGTPLPAGQKAFTFRIYDREAGGSKIWPPGSGEDHKIITDGAGLWNASVGMTIPLTPDVFADTSRWLEIEVDDGVNPVEILPRVRLNTLPYAYRSAKADTAFAIVGGGTSDTDWDLVDSVLYTGNNWGIARGGAGNVLYGDSTHSMVNLGVACTTGVSGGNSFDMSIGGGARHTARGTGTTIGGGHDNRTLGHLATIGGGGNNAANHDQTTVSGGRYNSALGTSATIGGGYQNYANATDVTIGGGYADSATGPTSTIGGGAVNTASGASSTVAGGLQNLAGNTDATVGGGYADTASGYRSTIGGGAMNTADGELSTVCGGRNNTAEGLASAIVGGAENHASGTDAVILGGYANTASGYRSTIGGGTGNIASNVYAVIGGGHSSIASGIGSIVAGGKRNIAADTFTTVSGGSYNKALALGASVGGGFSNHASGYLSVIGGGGDWQGPDSNVASGEKSVIGGGAGNRATGKYAVIAGGYGSNAVDSATVAGGIQNSANGFASSVGGGLGNSAAGRASTAAGGEYNRAGSQYAAIGGGDRNFVTGDFSCVPGGQQDTVTGSHSMAFGHGVYVSDDRRVTFFDSDHSGTFRLNRDDRTASSRYPIHVGTSSFNGNGAYLTEGGTWTNGSSQEFKDSFAPLKRQELLDRIAQLSIESWEYKGGDEKHIGPVAEDFVAAFDVGVIREDGTRDNQYLSHGDLAGVALAAIQELHKTTRELEKKTDRIDLLEAQLAELRQMILKVESNQK